MIGERENFDSNTNYGDLIMRAFTIAGNEINAFYDGEDNLVFVLDNTINTKKPNVLLVINPDGNKKWDEILSSDYDVELETIRPKVDNKYQKLDIEYSGLSVYENLINAYQAGDSLDDALNQLAILRDSASRHSAMMRLNMANDIISKTNMTIVKTKETIVRLETRIKTLRSKLSATKKEIGKVSTKQSASKILKLESLIEATNEKLKRAKKRLESAQKRLEAATVDAELASDLLNQPSVEIKRTKKNKAVIKAPEYPVEKTPAPITNSFQDDDEDDEQNESDEYDDDNKEEITATTESETLESDVKPLFNEDPQILNEDIAFKPIEFNAPVFNEPKSTQPETPTTEVETRPVLESITKIEDPVEPSHELTVQENTLPETFEPIDDVPEFIPEPVREETKLVETFEPINDVPEFIPEPVREDQSVLDTMTPVANEDETITAPATPVPPVTPITPVINTFQAPTEIKSERSHPGIAYYILLMVLIALSVFTLWLYQKNMKTDTVPALEATTTETTILEPKKNTNKATPPAPTIKEAEPEPVFLDVTESVTTSDAAPIESASEQEQIESDTDVAPTMVETVPIVMDAVPGRLNTSGSDVMEEVAPAVSEEDILATKPIYEPGAKYDEMFIDEQDFDTAPVDTNVAPTDENIVDQGYEYGFIDEATYADDPYFDAEEAAYQAEMANY